jgi:hypothetical protein
MLGAAAANVLIAAIAYKHNVSCVSRILASLRAFDVEVRQVDTLVRRSMRRLRWTASVAI